jgi:two-component system sensor histidine kinase AlgZ
MARVGALASLRAFFAGPIRFGWLNAACVVALGFAFGPDDWLHWPSRSVAWLSLAVPFLCFAIPIQLAYDHLFERLAGTRPLAPRAFVFHVAVIGGGVLAGVEVGVRLVSPLLRSETVPLLETILREVGLLGTALAVAGGFSWDHHQEVRSRATRAERAALEAQVQALQARIQPHFLFNCLNTVASLIEEDPKRAEAALLKLSELFRYTLAACERAHVPLAAELATVEGFLELERLRHPDRLKLGLDVAADVADVPVPPLVLQPLVENAVLHGVAPRREGGRVEVQVRRDGDTLRLSVEDDGPGPGGSPYRGSGTALADLRSRLGLLYGDAARVDVGRGSLGGTRVELRLPLAPRAVA